MSSYWDMENFVPDSFESLLGKTLVSVEKRSDDMLVFTTNTEEYVLTHIEDCCEHVYIEDIVGELNDLVGMPITYAVESRSDVDVDEYGGEQQWTFYKLATMKGWVDIRWNGSSNGYYSISVNFFKSKTNET